GEGGHVVRSRFRLVVIVDITHHRRDTPAGASEHGLVPGTRSGRRVVNPELVPRAGALVPPWSVASGSVVRRTLRSMYRVMAGSSRRHRDHRLRHLPAASWPVAAGQ